ncbi:MAG TPA: hypothetical protein VGG39_10565 [Polyangiaceae bacterium]|jgi:hypothetical protein
MSDDFHPAAGTPARAPMSVDELPGEMLVACHEALKLVMPVPDHERRREVLAVCECNDPRARELAGLLAREQKKDVELLPDHAFAVSLPQPDVARVAREAGYSVPVMMDPGVGHMWVFFFVRGGLLAVTMRVEDEVDVRRAEDDDRAANEAFALRVFEQKQLMIATAVQVLLAKEELRLGHIVVAFGSRTETARTVFRELAALPAQKGFPTELPNGVPVMTVSYEHFKVALRRRGCEPTDIDASVLGASQVRLAVFTPGGVHIRRIEPTALGRGGSA